MPALDAGLDRTQHKAVLCHMLQGKAQRRKGLPQSLLSRSRQAALVQASSSSSTAAARLCT